jgi:hypothetical protein
MRKETAKSERNEALNSGNASESAQALDAHQENSETTDKARETFKLWISLNPFSFKGDLKLD